MRTSGLNNWNFNNVNGSTIGNATGGRSSHATRRLPCRAPVRSTADRVSVAWHHSGPLARHSLMAACATSVALVLSLRLSVILASTTATVGVLLATAALIDVHERRLPNRLLAAALVFAFSGAALSLDGAVVLDALLGMLTAGGLMLCVRITRGVGMGDVKMASAIGASVGAVAAPLLAVPIAIAITAFAASVYGLIANRQRVPLGPFLWFGWAATLASAGWLS